MIMQQVFFSESELKELSEFKEISGMSFKAILQKAFNYYIKHDLPYIKNRYIFYASIGQERKKRKAIGVSDQLNSELTAFCKQNNYSKSSVAAQAILAFIRKDKQSHY